MDIQRGFGSGELFELVPAQGEPTSPLRPEQVPSVMVDVIHDGHVIPEEALVDGKDATIGLSRFHDAFVSERDWGASVVAGEVSRALGLPGYHRINLARVVMDFGRFPGSTPRSAPHLQRFAINYPFSELLSFRQKRTLLERYYDPISDEMDRVVAPRRLKLAIHTYDPYNANGTLRAPVSLITRVDGLHIDEVTDAFDPLYPHQLGEWTADRILRNRISLVVEKSGFGVAHNFPYTLPEGSIEVRAQVWRFFNFLQKAFLEEHPQTREDPAFQAIWAMLKDTNRRNAQSMLLRAFLHQFQRPPVGEEGHFEKAQLAYERVERFLNADNRSLVRKYRYAPWRPSAMAVEIRKDLVFDFDDNGHPVGAPLKNAARIGDAIAAAVRVYLDEDKPLDL